MCSEASVASPWIWMNSGRNKYTVIYLNKQMLVTTQSYVLQFLDDTYCLAALKHTLSQPTDSAYK